MAAMGIPKNETR